VDLKFGVGDLLQEFRRGDCVGQRIVRIVP